MSRPADGGGSTDSLTVPSGDPAGLRVAATALLRTASLVGGGADAIGSEARSVVSAAGWTGAAERAFSARARRLAGQVRAVGPPLAAIAHAVQVYADALAAAQAQGRKAVAAAATAHHLGRDDAPAALQGARHDAAAAGSVASAAAAVATSAVLGAIGELPDRREAAPVPLGADPAEREAASLYEEADKINGAIGWFVSPVAGGLAAREGQVWVEAAQEWSAAPELARAALFSDVVGQAGLAYDRGELGLSELAGAFGRFQNGSDAIDAFASVVHPTEFESLATGGVPDAGWAGIAGRAFGVLGIGSDLLTLYNPGTQNQAEGDVNRAAAGLNLLGSATIVAPEASTAAVGMLAGAAGLDASVGWVPVAGQVVVAGTALYLAGDWAYHHVQWFHDGVNAAAHGVATAAKDTAHAVDTAVTDTAHAVSTAASDTWHAATTVASGAVHGAEQVAHDLNPLNW